MKVVKINAIWCGACLIMNKVWKRIMDERNIETINLDYDIDEDEVRQYEVGNKLPVFIFYKRGKEIKRMVGEHSYEDMIRVIDEVENA